MRVLTILLLLMSTALAQTPAPLPIEQALSERLLEELNANIQLRIQLIAARAKIKELEEKDKPK